jgi:hypothetical protein
VGVTMNPDPPTPDGHEGNTPLFQRDDFNPSLRPDVAGSGSAGRSRDGKSFLTQYRREFIICPLELNFWGICLGRRKPHRRLVSGTHRLFRFYPRTRFSG